MRTIRFKTLDDFQEKLANAETAELADCLLESIQRGIKKGQNKVTVCDVEIEQDDEQFRLYSTKEDWPTALKGCMATFIKSEEYEKCIVVQELEKEYEIKKMVESANAETPKTKTKTSKKNLSSKN